MNRHAIIQKHIFQFDKKNFRHVKKIGYGYCCVELFVVKHKSKHSWASAIYFNLGADIIKENCKFAHYFNKTDITSMVLDGGNEIILANWPGDNNIICKANNDIPVKFPSYPYVLVNRNVLCNCAIEAESNFLLESLGAVMMQILNLKCILW